MYDAQLQPFAIAWITDAWVKGFVPVIVGTSRIRLRISDIIINPYHGHQFP